MVETPTKQGFKKNENGESDAVMRTQLLAEM